MSGFKLLRNTSGPGTNRIKAGFKVAPILKIRKAKRQVKIMGIGYRHARLQGDLLSAYLFIHLSRGNKNKYSKAYACLEEVKHFE